MVNMDGMPSDMERLRVRHGQKAIVEIRCNRAFSRDADGKSIEGSYELIFFDVPTDREVFTLISGIKGNATEIQRTVAAYCLTVQLAHSGLFKEGNK